jgi:4-hydroxy-3-methylbut-2-enyl diphosphate reductase
MKIILAQPRGFCAGVVRAIDTAERALEKYGAPVYVRHEIVHNRHVVESLKAKGARFVDELSEAPPGAVTIFSAHGVSRKVENEGRSRALPTIDATCPLVTKVHNQGRRYVAQGRILIFIGHAGHPEVEGTLGQIDGELHLVESEADVEKLPIAPHAPIAYMTQTTFSVDDTRGVIAALHRRFSDVKGPEIRDICYATQNRQTAVRELSRVCDVVIVVGARNSSNSNRLREIGEEAGLPSYLVVDGGDIKAEWVKNARAVGVTAGASAPEILVDDVVQALMRIEPCELSNLDGLKEKVSFRLPAELMS